MKSHLYRFGSTRFASNAETLQQVLHLLCELIYCRYIHLENPKNFSYTLHFHFIRDGIVYIYQLILIGIHADIVFLYSNRYFLPLFVLSIKEPSSYIKVFPFAVKFAIRKKSERNTRSFGCSGPFSSPTKHISKSCSEVVLLQHSTFYPCFLPELYRLVIPATSLSFL